MKKFMVIMCFCCAVAFSAQALAATIPTKDSTQMNLSAINAVTAKPVGGIHVGTVIAWPVANNPEDGDKWLECNGQAISPSVYPELFALVGGSVPDFRGLFLRGVGGNSAALGIQQDDAFKTHFHQTPHFAQKNSGAGDGSNYFAGWGGYMTTNTTVSTDSSETRPKNKAVRYLVRALP